MGEIITTERPEWTDSEARRRMRNYFSFLKARGADERLIRHARVAYEVGLIIATALREVGIQVDTQILIPSLIVHHAGKIIHPDELTSEGSNHLEAGWRLLIESNVDEKVARACRSHERWDEMECSIEELIVALADALWKGERIPELEKMFIDRIWSLRGGDYWDTFLRLDTLFESIAEEGSKRLLENST